MPETLKKSFEEMTEIIETATAAMEKQKDLTKIVQLGHAAFVHSFKVDNPGIKKLKELVKKKARNGADSYFADTLIDNTNKKVVADGLRLLIAAVEDCLDKNKDKDEILLASSGKDGSEEWPEKESNQYYDVLNELDKEIDF